MLPANNVLYMQATTACLTAIIITQVGNVFACRSFRESVFSIGFFSNKLIFIGIAFEIALQLFIVYHPWGNKIFSTAPISVSIWLILIPFAVILFIAEEIRKFVNRKYFHPPLFPLPSREGLFSLPLRPRLIEEKVSPKPHLIQG
jgi:sodium/potassium-transporting ATPase subunit alpha